MKHEDVWRAIDTLAAENGLSASGLAKRSGLDATTFNPSKRTMPDGRARWPSTESVAKVLNATGASLESFTSLVSGARSAFSAASTHSPSSPSTSAAVPARNTSDIRSSCQKPGQPCLRLCRARPVSSSGRALVCLAA